MKKKIIALLFGMAAAIFCPAVISYASETEEPGIIIETAFPDAELQAYVQENFDKDGDGALSREEIDAAAEIDLNFSWVEDLTGIENLTALKKLDIGSTYVQEVDVSRNTKLEDLNMSGCYDIAEIDISKNTALVSLNIMQTDISAVDLTNNTALVTFNAERTHIDKVDFSKNPALEEVNLTNTKVLSADFSNLRELKKLELNMVPFQSLDVSNNTKLEELKLIGDEGIKTLDISNNAWLKVLDISGTQVSDLTLEANTALEEFYNYAQTYNKFKHDGPMAGFDDEISIVPAPVKSLNLNKCKGLKKLRIDGSAVTSLDIHAVPELVYFAADNTKIAELKDLDLTAMPNLNRISVKNAGIQSIKLNESAAYTLIHVDGNELLWLEYPKNVSEDFQKEAKFGEQSRTLKVSSSAPADRFELGRYVKDPARVSITDIENAEYDSSTGIVTLKGDKKSFTYTYDVDGEGKCPMLVTVSIEKKSPEEEAEEKAEADKKAAQPVIDMIAAIGNVTVNSDSAVAKVRKAYDALTDDQKRYVNNYKKLTDAENRIADLKKQADKAKKVSKIKASSVKKLKVKAGKKKAAVTWKAPAVSVDKYVVYRSTKKSSGFKAIKTTKSKKLTVKKLKRKKTYYFKVRGYKKIDGKKVYTKYSKTVKVKIK